MLDNLTQTPEPATKDDAARLAELIVIAGDGLPLVVWEGMREGGENLMDIGAARAARETGGFSYCNADVIRHQGAVISALVSYALTEKTSQANLATVPELFKPLVKLENRVVPSWYVNVLATIETARRKGAGTTLLSAAETKARAGGYRHLSLITGDINPARSLYESFGFRVAAQERIVKDGWDYAGENWLLYVKDLGAVRCLPCFQGPVVVP